MIKEVSIENFKAIHKEAHFPLQAFSVFIGNNGTGKTSVVDFLRLLQIAVRRGLGEAFEELGSLDKVRNYNACIKLEHSDLNESNQLYEPLRIKLSSIVNSKIFDYEVQINVSRDGGYYIVEYEKLTCNNEDILIAKANSDYRSGTATILGSVYGPMASLSYTPNRLWLGYQPSYMSNELNEFTEYIDGWQFLYLNAHAMGRPSLQNRVDRTLKLNYDGSNIADYLLWIKNNGGEYLDNLIRKMQFVLPYIDRLESQVLEGTKNNEVELLLYEISERSKPLPGWLLSSGTLRVLALLSMFETPKPPSVLFVDEIENGLDPRTIGLFLSEVENAIDRKGMQVILTTHSPYLLDLVPLENIIVVEKEEEGSKFHLPENQEGIDVWKKRFSAGKLYTMGKLTK